MKRGRVNRVLAFAIAAAATGIACTPDKQAMSQVKHHEDALNARTTQTKHHEDVSRPTVPFELGSEMDRISRRMTDLWHAGIAGDQGLALRELNEIYTAFETIRNEDIERNGVRFTGLLEAIESTQLATLKGAVETGNREKFEHAYRETMTTCNECHRIVDHGDIRIDDPSASRMQ